MSRTYSTITWGLALIVSAAVMAWQQSLPWSLAAAGVVPVIAGLIQGFADTETEGKQAKTQEQYDPSRSDSF